MEIQMQYYLVVSTVMFFAGVYGFVTRRNLIAVNINFAVFNRYLFPGQMEGLFFSIFSIAIAAAETAVAIAIIVNIYRNMKNIEVKNLDELKD